MYGYDNLLAYLQFKYLNVLKRHISQYKNFKNLFLFLKLKQFFMSNKLKKSKYNIYFKKVYNVSITINTYKITNLCNFFNEQFNLAFKKQKYSFFN